LKGSEQVDDDLDGMPDFSDDEPNFDDSDNMLAFDDSVPDFDDDGTSS
jgi:hypothetical protein